MPDLNSVALIIVLSAAVGIVWVFYFWIYWAYRVDKTRQDLFELRDELFDLTADGRLSFDHPAYIRLRSMINNMIRFAHQLDFVNLVALIYVSWRCKGVPSSVMTRFIESIEAIEAVDVRKKTWEIFARTNKVMATHLILGSIPLMLLLTSGAVILILRIGWNRFIQKLSGGDLPGIAQLDARAVAEPA